MSTGTSIWNKSALATLALLSLAACGGSPESTVGSQKDPVVTLQPTFASLSKNIFEPKCAGCHKGGGANAPVIAFNGVPVFFESQQQLLMAGQVVPGEVDQSLLYLRTALAIPGQMPSETAPLSAAEIEAIRAWIAGLGSDGIILTPGPIVR